MVPKASPWAARRCPAGTPADDPVLPITGTPAPTSGSHHRSYRLPVPDFAKALRERREQHSPLPLIFFHPWSSRGLPMKKRRVDLRDGRRHSLEATKPRKRARESRSWSRPRPPLGNPLPIPSSAVLPLIPTRVLVPLYKRKALRRYAQVLFSP